MKTRTANQDRQRAGPGATGVAARRAALDILARVEREAAYADILLAKDLSTFDQPDRGLITRLVLGTTAWRARLDYEIACLADRPVAEIDLTTLMILRLGLFQLRFLDRIPAHAAVNTAVSIAKAHSISARATGMVNAVLRRAASNAPPLPECGTDEPGRLAIAYSHPRWLVDAFIGWFGRERAERIMTADNEPAPHAARLNLARGARDEIVAQLRHEGLEFDANRTLPETIVFTAAPRLDSPAYAGGLFYFQSEASQLVSRMLAPSANSRVADCAAAPGGKAAHLAELVGHGGRVFAFDRNLKRLAQSRLLVRRLGHRRVVFVCADMAGEPPVQPHLFDAVLLDAPCTGLGTLREHPELRWRLGPADIIRMAALQERMIECAQSLVRPGGVLVYSVCSLAPAEGREIVGRFLARHPEFSLDRGLPAPLGKVPVPGVQGFLETAPDLGGLDGFFAARLQRATL